MKKVLGEKFALFSFSGPPSLLKNCEIVRVK
jgi:hypothetical protein